MTKEQFIKQMTVIEDYIAAQRNADKLLNDAFFKESTPSAFDFGDDLINLAIEQLSELSGIAQESIEWYVFEPKGTCTYTDGFEMNIRTAADFWDFNQYEPNKKNNDE